jgi:hypothetical protein
VLKAYAFGSVNMGRYGLGRDAWKVGLCY